MRDMKDLSISAMTKLEITIRIVLRKARKTVYQKSGIDFYRLGRPRASTSFPYFLSINEQSYMGSDIRAEWETHRFSHLPSEARNCFNLKNFDGLKAICKEISEWIDQYPTGYSLQWTCAMEVAIRATNWLWAYQWLKRVIENDKDFQQKFFKSIQEHGKFIEQNLEVYLRMPLGNHYLSNIAGLLNISILCPALRRAKRWKSFALREIQSQIAEQVFPDGFNFENSISYHRFVTEIFFYCAVLCRRYQIPLHRSYFHRLEKMFECIMYYNRPDGKTPGFGDADDGRWHIPDATMDAEPNDHRNLLALGAVFFRRSDFKAVSDGHTDDVEPVFGKEGIKTFNSLPQDSIKQFSKAFPDSGIYIMRRNDLYLAIMTQNNHAHQRQLHRHNDIFHFELCAGNAPFLVDSGTYCYTKDPEKRNNFRATAAHNTLTIDGMEQHDREKSEFFDLHRCGTVSVDKWEIGGSVETFTASYTRHAMDGKSIIHKRTIQFFPKKYRFEMSDFIKGNPRQLDWYFHFHPDTRVQLDNTLCICSLYGKTMKIWLPKQAQFDLKECNISFRYGEEIASRKLHGTILGTRVDPIVLTFKFEFLTV